MSLEQFLKEYEEKNTSRWSNFKKRAKNALIGAAMLGLTAGGVVAQTPTQPKAGIERTVQDPGQYVPYVDGDTTITAFNPTDNQMTVTASYALIGNDPRNGAQTQVTLQPHATMTIPNALPDDPHSTGGSAFLQASGSDEPVLTASTEHTDGSGMNIPVLPYSAKNNRDPQAGILANGMQWEREIDLSGDNTGNNTINNQAYGSDGTGPTNASPAHLPSGIVTVGKVGDIFNGGLPPGSTDIFIPKYSNQSKAGGVLSYEDPVSGDTRLRPMQNFTTYLPPDQYDTMVQIIVFDDSQGTNITSTGIHDQTMKDWTGAPDLSYLVPHDEYTCTTTPVQMENLIDRFKNNLTQAEEQELTNNAASQTLPYFVGGCDTNQTKHMYMIMFDITPKSQ